MDPERVRAAVERIVTEDPTQGVERLGLTREALYLFMDRGDLPRHRFGRFIKLKRSEVDAHIESCRIEPGALAHLHPESVGASGTEGAGGRVR